MKLKNKLLILLIVFILFCLTLNINVFASTDFTFRDQTIILPDIFYEKEYHFSYYGFSNGGIYSLFLIASDNPIYFTFNNNNCYISASNDNFLFYSYMSPTFKADFSNITMYNKETYSIGLSGEYYYFSSHDIYNGDNLVFQAPPQVEPTILAPIVEGTQTQETLAEILAILPKILLILVSLIGLRKALKMLSALLHRS